MFLNIMKEKASSFKIKIEESILFPRYYPEIIRLHISNGIIYIMGWKRDSGKLKHFLRIFNTNGKMISENFIDLGKQDSVEQAPFSIEDWTLYQLKENENEDWVLHISPLK